ncbi:MAG TPA: response regulator transcription factor, partial [Gammaproteobacteria bacterium]|nr:response regulator transcription factor [Gammaproteobacteria bacterium]
CYGAVERFLGLLASTRGDTPAAVAHFEAGVALDRRTGSRPYAAHGRCDLAAVLLERGGTGDRDAAVGLLSEARATAGELGMKSLLARIDGLSPQGRPGSGARSRPAGLSGREVEVLRLLAAGRSNREIAVSLFVSPHTVANHVRSILGKTGTANRTEAAAFARKSNLLEG